LFFLKDDAMFRALIVLIFTNVSPAIADSVDSDPRSILGLQPTMIRSHDLLMTFGPAFKVGSPNFAITSHEVQEFGIAATNGNRTILAPFVPQ
jgi:hypothetical protein